MSRRVVTEPSMRFVTEKVDLIGPYLRSMAIFDAEHRYRFVLERTWHEERPTMLLVMANPSDAGAEKDDPTVTRAVGFARTYGMGTLRVLNLYPWIATRPENLWKAAKAGHDITGGSEHDALMVSDLHAMTMNGGLTVVAWGKIAKPDRVAWFLEHSFGQWSLGVNKDGSPKHPLYLAKATALSVWPPQEPEPEVRD